MLKIEEIYYDIINNPTPQSAKVWDIVINPFLFHYLFHLFKFGFHVFYQLKLIPCSLKIMSIMCSLEVNIPLKIIRKEPDSALIGHEYT